MNTPTPDPLTVLATATDYGLTEHQAEAALLLAANYLVDAWQLHADAVGEDRADGSAMERWAEQFTPCHRRAVLEESITIVLAADADSSQVPGCSFSASRLPRVMRTSRPRVHIR
ncbi:hypothetical protein CP973_38950 [Streptomyces albofaciens JCM 4342]|uniref:hypothetical protein n=1 Tax=Streptomyces albofaciens TaxID=66866 RepID=UPI000A8EBF09|nr:hypothetical protein [Streptomyces albofaciens]KAA6214989.1 hypothetical protein CP973_38950 [Streptomyces albofaciens JCM 4342]